MNFILQWNCTGLARPWQAARFVDMLVRCIKHVSAELNYLAHTSIACPHIFVCWATTEGFLRPLQQVFIFSLTLCSLTFLLINACVRTFVFYQSSVSLDTPMFSQPIAEIRYRSLTDMSVYQLITSSDECSRPFHPPPRIAGNPVHSALGALSSEYNSG